MTGHNRPTAGAILAFVIVAIAAMTASVAAQPADPTDAGKAVFKRANCFRSSGTAMAVAAMAAMHCRCARPS